MIALDNSTLLCKGQLRRLEEEKIRTTKLKIANLPIYESFRGNCYEASLHSNKIFCNIGMNDFFTEVIPSNCNGLDDYLRKRFSDKIGSLKGLELGGTGRILFSDFKKIFEKSYGVTLRDSFNDFFIFVNNELKKNKKEILKNYKKGWFITYVKYLSLRLDVLNYKLFVLRNTKQHETIVGDIMKKDTLGKFKKEKFGGK
jgi:hypothetical protein